MDNLSFEKVKSVIQSAIDEDLRDGDVTSSAVFSADHRSQACIVSKSDGIFCGGFMAEYVYSLIDKRITTRVHVEEGKPVSAGTTILEISGSTKAILEGERILLNFLQRMCGIATKTARIASLVEGSSIRILDTRKTVPGLRLLDKYSVAAGGGTNHRMGLFDMVMIKDNHITAAGSIRKAVELVLGTWGERFRIEVETKTLEEVQEAVSSGVDIIMLDNMDKNEIQNAVEEINGRTEIELSGNMDEAKIRDLAELPVDYISIGALTHSVEAFDLSMRIE